jgi:hypothetical protein
MAAAAPADDHGELLVAGDGQHLRGRGADALARADAVGEADDRRWARSAAGTSAPTGAPAQPAGAAGADAP